MGVSGQMLGKELPDCTERIVVWLRSKSVWTCLRSEKLFEMPEIHPDYPVSYYADYASCSIKITYINSTLIVQSITLVNLSVPTIEIENMMRSRSNKFCMHHRSYIRTRRSLIGMPSYELPLVRG